MLVLGSSGIVTTDEICTSSLESTHKLNTIFKTYDHKLAFVGTMCRQRSLFKH